MNVQVAPIDPEYLDALRNNEIHGHMVGALAEFIDNSIGANARKIEIHFKKGVISIFDDGDGVADMSEIFVLGRGSNRKSNDVINLGQYGQGGTTSALYMGWKVAVGTVHGEHFKQHSIDWETVRKTGVWPSDYYGTMAHRSKAPKVLKNGGTVITIGKRHTDLAHRSFIGKSMAERLAKLYAPALEDGVSITIHQYNKNDRDDAPSKIYDLGQVAQAYQLEGCESHSLVVDGKPLTFTFGEIPTGSPVERGCHVIFGPRVIETLSMLNAQALPGEFWGQIELGAEWKKSLSRNKVEVQASLKELQEAVYELAKDLIEELRNKRRSLRLDMINSQLALALNGAAAGGPGRGDNPDPENPPARYRFWEPANWKSPRQPRGKGARSLQVEDTALGTETATDVVVEEDVVVVQINNELSFLSSAYEEPINSPLLWSVIVSALTADVEKVTNIFQHNEHLNTLLEMDEPQKALQYLQATLYEAAPTVREPTAADYREATQ